MSKTFRNATLDDLDAIVSLIAEAKEQLRLSGSTQWQSGEPSRETLYQDILNGTCFIVIQEELVATINISFTEDAAYNRVFDGKWSSTDPYATLHRIAIKKAYQGQNILSELFDEAKGLSKLKGIQSMRIDTHRMNAPMIKSIERYGFKRIGYVQVKDPVDPNREAFEYLI